MGTLNFTCGTKYSRHVSGDAAIPERLPRFPWGSPFIFIAVAGIASPSNPEPQEGQVNPPHERPSKTAIPANLPTSTGVPVFLLKASIINSDPITL